MAIIGTIRKHAGLAVALIGIAIIGFVIQDAFGGRGQSAPPVAVIDGESISYDLFSLQVDQLTDQYIQSQGGNVSLTDADREQIRTIAWQRMLSDLLMNEACSKTGIQVSSAELNDMYYGKFISPILYQYFTNPQTGQYDRQQVMNIINNFSQMDPQSQAALSELENIVKTERLKEKYINLASKSYYVPKALAMLQASQQSTSVNARYVSLPYSSVADTEVELTKSDYQKFYNENKYMFKQNKSREISYVVFDVTPTPQDMADINKEVNELYVEFQQENNVPDFVNAVTSGDRFDSLYRNESEVFQGWDDLFDAEPGTYFEPRRMGQSFQMAKLMDVQMRPDSMYIHHIFLSYTEAGSQSGRNKTQSRQLADSLLKVINANPAQFGDLAVRFSEDPTAQQSRGELGWMLDGTLMSNLNKAALATPAGKATMAEAPNGFHILYVAQKTQPVKKILAAVVNIPIEPSTATTKSVYTRANQLMADCHGNVAQMDSAARKIGMRVRKNSVTELASSLPGVNSAREVIRWAFNDDTKEGSVASQVFEMENRYVIAGLSSINEDEYMSLERAMEMPQIANMVRQNKKFNILAQKMEGNSLETIAQNNNIKIDTVFGMSMNGYPSLNGYEPKIVGAMCGSTQGQLSKAFQGNNGVFRFIVDNIAAPEATPAEIVRLTNQLEMQYTQSAANRVYSALEEAAVIEDNRGFYF
ncbi:MAG: SurA N-terminal domain-containing protein [Bacteroidetes bacterium]|uniref:Periplasmic chaperone PpiD n=1 Tax=Candidatus Pullibacteroides excrementavium TaxID=2840905 RepID=A0A9D9DU28_9BACT|nr:SurA N-terminal domain-containing protein [Candidatus Pullibacteroides excrementavium]